MENLLPDYNSPSWLDASNCSGVLGRNSCYLTPVESGKRDALAGIRIIVSTLSILGASSIIASGIRLKRQVFSHKIHPIFVLSIADLLLAVGWAIGGVLWFSQLPANARVWCFSVSLVTVISECITVNLTLVYALLAYSSIHQKDVNIPLTTIVTQPTSERVCGVWHPAQTIIIYILAWVLPVIIVMVPFGVIAGHYHIVRHANTCSCWCIPTFGNILPFANQGDIPTFAFVHQMRKLILAYAVILSVHYLVVFVLLVVVYYKILKRIKKMKTAHEENRVHNYGTVTRVMVQGHSKAKKRIVYFVAVFIISGFFNLVLSIWALYIEAHFLHREHRDWPEVNIVDPYSSAHQIDPKTIYALYLLQSVTVPLQGLLNALVYGWTRDDFCRKMMKQGESDSGVDLRIRGKAQKKETSIELSCSSTTPYASYAGGMKSGAFDDEIQQTLSADSD